MARNIMPTPVYDAPTAQKRPIELTDSDPENDVTKEEEEMFKRLQASFFRCVGLTCLLSFFNRRKCDDGT